MTRDMLAAEGRWRTVRDTVSAAVGTVLGIAPHVLHHLGLLAGTALITGASGNALLYVIGLLFSVPMLRRSYRHFRTPWAPAIAVAIFTALFSLSAFVVGPAVSGTGDQAAPNRPVEVGSATPGPNHDEHHE